VLFDFFTESEKGECQKKGKRRKGSKSERKSGKKIMPLSFSCLVDYFFLSFYNSSGLKWSLTENFTSPDLR